MTLNGVIGTLAGTFTKDGTGTVTLGAANTYTGTTTVNAGTLAISASNRIADNSAITLNAGSTFSLGGSFSERMGTLSYDTSTIDFGTTGTANSFMFGAAGTNAGTLTVTNWEQGSDNLARLSASPAPAAAFLQNMYFEGFGSGAQEGAANQTIIGYGALWTLITPTLNLSTWNGLGGNNLYNTGANWVGGVAPVSGNFLKLNFTGNTRLTPDMNANYTANTLKFDTLANAFTLGSSTASTLTLNGIRPSIIQLSANNQVVNHLLSLAVNTEVVTSGAGTLTLNGNISGAGGISKRGASTLILTGNNSYAGATTIDAGAVNIQSNNALGGTAAGTTVAVGAALQVQGGIAVGAENLTLNGSGIGGTGALRSISGNNTWAGGVVVNSQNVYFGVDAGQLTINGVVSGPCAADLTKVGAGTLILTANNTVGGLVTINGGTLDAAGTGSLGAIDAITINPAGTLLLTGASTDRINDSATITMNGGTLTSAHHSETMGVLTFSVDSTLNLGAGVGTGDLRFADGFSGAGATWTINNWQGPIYTSGTADRVFFSNTLTAGWLAQIQFTGFQKGAYQLASGEIVPIPEPATWVVGFLVLTAMLVEWVRRRRGMAPLKL